MVRKLLGGILIAVLLINLVLFGLGRISNTLFWIVLGIGALAAYIVRRYPPK